MSTPRTHQIEHRVSEEYPSGGNLFDIIEGLREDIDSFDGALEGIATEEFVTTAIAAAAAPSFSTGAPAVEGIISPDALKAYVRDLFFPVSRIIITYSAAEDPNVTIGGSWSVVGTGRMPIGLNAAVAELNTIGNTGGAMTTTLSIENLPSHGHLSGVGLEVSGPAPYGSSGVDLGALTQWVDVNAGTPTAQAFTGETGLGTAVSTVSPYFVVKYWVRTA